MIEWLVSVDTTVFNFVNQGLANQVCDLVMPIITDRWFLRGTLAAILLAMLTWGKRRGRIAAIFCIAAIAVADQVSASVLKPLVERIRPCHVIPSVHLLVDCSQGLSFPSSHAANVFAVAVFLSPNFQRARWPLFVIAILVCYSRIAVGVHYPIDVLVGAVVGTASGLLSLAALRWTYARLSVATNAIDHPNRETPS